jgi:hypothetical protein
MKATETIVLYRESNKTIIAEVYEDEHYFIQKDVSVYVGTMESFKKEFPDYKIEE